MKTSTTTVRCVEVRRPQSHGTKFRCVYQLTSMDLAAGFDGAEDGEVIELTYREMPREDFDALPDFEGW